MPAVLTERHGAVLKITLNRPDRLNAVSIGLYEQVIANLDEAEADPDLRAVVIHGAGRAFCVGADLKDHGAAQRTQAELDHYVDLGQRVCERIQTVPVPVVAAVHGYALGAGAEMATSADFLVMGRTAQMGFPEISIGTFVGGGVTRRLPRLIGLRRTTDLLTLGTRFTGEQAAAWSLAYEATPDEEVLTRALALADTLSAKAPLSFAALKASLYADAAPEQVLRQEAQTLLTIMKSADWAEGVAAFAERRDPVFTGK